LHDKEVKLDQVSKNLQDKEYKLKNINALLEKSKLLLGEQEEVLVHNKKMLEKRQKMIEERDKELLLSKDEIKKLNRMLLEANTQQDKLSGKIVIIQNLLDKKQSTIKTQNKLLVDAQKKMVVLSNQLTQSNERIDEQDKKMLQLLNALDERKTKYDDLVAKLQAQKAKIKALTGIKLKVIAALKEELGNKVNIDKKSGSLRLASNILFDKGSYELKEASKSELKKAFEEYMGTLVTSPKIQPYLDKVIIEGHTDSDGGYLYNLDLSQKRALAVMNFLITLDFAKKYNIQPLMTASGRAYLDAIKVNGLEDKEASRRIEIKFTLKNQDAMEEIEKVLDAE
jgi:chemotaxis protein MotB